MRERKRPKSRYLKFETSVDEHEAQGAAFGVLLIERNHPTIARPPNGDGNDAQFSSESSMVR